MNVIKKTRFYELLRFYLKYNIFRNKIISARNFYSSNNLNVLSKTETISIIKQNRLSFVRIGDGEMYCLMNQMKNKTSSNNLCDNFMRDYLRMILKNDNEKLLIGLLNGPNDIDNINSTAKYPKQLNLYEYIWFRFYPKIFRYVDLTKTYGNVRAFKISTESDINYSALEGILSNENEVLVISENGLINSYHEIFSLSKTINYVFCPSIHSHKSWEEILLNCKQYPQNHLFILSAGFLSKIIAFELSKLGYWAIDIGAVPVLYHNKS